MTGHCRSEATITCASLVATFTSRGHLVPYPQQKSPSPFTFQDPLATDNVNKCHCFQQAFQRLHLNSKQSETELQASLMLNMVQHALCNIGCNSISEAALPQGAFSTLPMKTPNC